MYMKTKEEVKEPSGKRREAPHRRNPNPQDGRQLLTSQLLDSSTSEFYERSGNVYENKEQVQNVMASRNGSVFHTGSSETRCDNPAGAVLESRYGNDGRPKGET